MYNGIIRKQEMRRQKMNWEYWFRMWDEEENKSFNTLVDKREKYNHSYGCEFLIASVKKVCYGAIVKRFQNDK